jgi:hypothetical protein
VTVANNVIHDTRQWMYNGEGVYVGSSSSGPLDNTNNVTIRNNQIFNINDEAVELKPGTHDCIVEGNTIHDAMRDPAYSGGAGAIEVNEATIDCPACAGRRQTWGSNPNHIVRNNVVHTSKTGIRLGTGATAYNNVVYNTPAPYYGILLTNNARDSYPRTVYHNTVNVDASRAVFGSGDIRNNIGPATTGNIAATSSLFVNAAAGDFHLVRNSAPINAGADLTSNVPTDMEGRARTQPDFGAYEFNGLTPAPAPPPPPPD